MDLWMKVEMPDGGEREYKHIVAKENNLEEITIDIIRELI